MLLYDQLHNHAECQLRRRGEANFGRANMVRLRNMKDVQVYELSNLVPLFEDWGTEAKKKVPRRPPAVPCWCEWTIDFVDAAGEDWSITAGVMISTVDKSILAAMNRAIPTPGSPQDLLDDMEPGSTCEPEAMDAFKAAEEMYGMTMFRRINRIPKAARTVHVTDMDGVTAQFHPGQILAEADYFVAAMRDMSRDVEILRTVTDMVNKVIERKKQLNYLDTCFGLPITTRRLSRYGDQSDLMFEPWPALMAFALMHCRNVKQDVEVPTERTQRQAAKHKDPPRCVHRRLRMTVPKFVTAPAHERAEDAPEGSERRYHFCNGSFHNLTHARWHEPGLYWYSGHWKGNKEVGEVKKTYDLRPGDAVAAQPEGVQP